MRVPQRMANQYAAMSRVEKKRPRRMMPGRVRRKASRVGVR
jgi:hypothetical protein